MPAPLQKELFILLLYKNHRQTINNSQAIFLS